MTETVHHCSFCDNPILDGEHYYWVCGERLCLVCFNTKYGDIPVADELEALRVAVL